MQGYEAILPAQWIDSPFHLIGKKTFLITCGNFRENHFNTMTGGWGMMGIMWGKNVFEIVVRPTRYTHDFLVKYPDFSICFLPESGKKALDICGSKSGRDTDKVKECGLTPAMCPSIGSPYFSEAETVIECKILFKSRFDPEFFSDPDLPAKFYPKKDFHTRFLGEITGLWRKKS